MASPVCARGADPLEASPPEQDLLADTGGIQAVYLLGGVLLLAVAAVGAAGARAAAAAS